MVSEPAKSRTHARALWRIAAADVSCGNKVLLLRNGMETFNAMQALIESAQESIEFEQYLFQRDETGRRFRDLLADAAKRGLRVRVLIDWIGRMGCPSSFFNPIREAGGEVRIFNPVGLHRWLGLIPRDHRKLLVADRHTGITGGIGIGDQWRRGLLRKRSSPWRDTAVQIAGPAALDMSDSFERMWERAGGVRRMTLRGVRIPRSTHLDPAIDPPALVGIVEGEPGRLRISRALQMQALGAERTIWIASAYFAPAWGEAEALSGAARDGVDVRVLVPSRYDHPWLRVLLEPYIRRLIGSGVRLWEWRGEMMHAKTSVVDGRWVRVGSTDFNALGVAINYELDAVIEDRALGRQAEEMFLEDLERSREIFVRRFYPSGTLKGPTTMMPLSPSHAASGPSGSGNAPDREPLAPGG